MVGGSRTADLGRCRQWRIADPWCLRSNAVEVVNARQRGAGTALAQPQGNALQTATLNEGNRALCAV